MQTVDDLYAGPAAERAKVQAMRIANSIHRRLGSACDVQPLSLGTSAPLLAAVTACRTDDGAPHSGSHHPPEVDTADMITGRAVIEEGSDTDEHL